MGRAVSVAFPGSPTGGGAARGSLFTSVHYLNVLPSAGILSLKMLFYYNKNERGSQCNISGKQYGPRILNVQLGLVILPLKVQQRN